MEPHESKWESLRNILCQIGLRSNQCKGEFLHLKSLNCVVNSWIEYFEEVKIFSLFFALWNSRKWLQKEILTNPLKHLSFPCSSFRLKYININYESCKRSDFYPGPVNEWKIVFQCLFIVDGRSVKDNSSLSHFPSWWINDEGERQLKIRWGEDGGK